ncbi:MAG: diaminopimelate decarboxylase [Bacteroidota bacterium]|nr:diaminopimelate decarboxylase [Bacteroidota bacterium]
MFNKEIAGRLAKLRTPFYYYDMDMLDTTLRLIRKEAYRYDYKIHYALKSNANEKILSKISSSGLGADCVSGNEILMALKTGFHVKDIVFAGVGKTDEEIIIGINNDIFCFNVESIQEMEVIDKLSSERKYASRIALRINPDIEAFTHKYITTGIEETKFGINIWELDNVIEKLHSLKNIELISLHFHIGSQIKRMNAFKSLCSRVNEIQTWFENRNITIDHINVGGGLGIDYDKPDEIPDFEEYFGIFNDLLELRSGQTVHFEPGRSVTGQTGSLITRVVYIKDGSHTNFAIVDAGMTDLIRPALYQAHHKIENISSDKSPGKYSVVGPICESSDSFGKYIELPLTKRGDLLAIRSAGAYGEVMTSNYNLRDKAPAVFSGDL